MFRLLFIALLALGCTQKPKPPVTESNPPMQPQVFDEITMPEPVGNHLDKEERTLNWPNGGTVLFEFDSYEVKDWAPVCKHYTGKICSVVGFACPIGDAGYNQSLSEARASAVAEKLSVCSVEQIDVQGKGETEEFGEYEQNRRAEFVCIDGR